MNGITLQALREEHQVLPLEEKQRLVRLMGQFWIQDQFRIMRAIADLKHGANLTPYDNVCVFGNRLLVPPGEVWRYSNLLYNHVEGHIFCQKGRVRRVFWVEPKPELLEAV